MAVYVTGDIHGDPTRLSKNSFYEQKNFSNNKDENVVIILGDFGLVWNRDKESKQEKYWLDWLNKKPFTTIFVDGNHENHKRLSTYPIKEWHEDYGHVNIYKRTVKIPQEDYNEILDYAKNNNCKDIKFDYCNGDDVIERIFYSNDTSNVDFSMGCGDIFVRHNHYHAYTDEDECVDLLFSKDSDDDDFPRGYVSFYMMERHDFEKAENVNLNLEKFMKDN